MRATTTSTNAAKVNFRPLGRAREGLSMSTLTLGKLGGPAISCCFCTANGGLFERPTAAFFTVVAAVVMPCMTVGMVGTTRRKTRFPTGVTGRHTLAKPTAVTTAFCVFGITLFIINDCIICRYPADVPAVVTPTAKRNSYRVAILLCTNTQGRGAAHLNPGLRNRNSYRVAGRKPHPGLPQGEGTQCQWIRI